jgi:hypothetical protein
MTIHVVTYATHYEGNLKNMIHNQYNIPITVLGMDSKWNGFMDKLNGVYNHILTLPNEELVMFLDGFDVFINSSLDGVEEMYKKFDKKVLFSKENDVNFITKYITKKIYGNGKDTTILNSGLYIGTVEHLKILLKYIIEENKWNDDQIAYNYCLKKFDFIGIDEKEELFKNTLFLNNIDGYSSKFIQNNGRLTLNRLYVSFKEFSHLFYLEIIILLLLGYILYLKNKTLFYMVLLTIVGIVVYYDSYYKTITEE